MTPAYSPIYLNKAARTLGNMLHDAVLEYGQDGSEFLQQFARSDIAEQFAEGHPKYVAGKSGNELYADVMESTTGTPVVIEVIRTYERSEVYWVGWMLAHYQWYSGRTFREILDVVPYEEFLVLYRTLHEADVQKAYEVLDYRFSIAESRLKSMRKLRGLTQEALANASGVSLNTIRAYERKAKDINKGQVEIVLKLAAALQCDIKDILE